MKRTIFSLKERTTSRDQVTSLFSISSSIASSVDSSKSKKQLKQRLLSSSFDILIDTSISVGYLSQRPWIKNRAEWILSSLLICSLRRKKKKGIVAEENKQHVFHACSFWCPLFFISFCVSLSLSLFLPFIFTCVMYLSNRKEEEEKRTDEHCRVENKLVAHIRSACCIRPFCCLSNALLGRYCAGCQSLCRRQQEHRRARCFSPHHHHHHQHQ